MRVRFVIHQSLATTVVLIVPLSKLAISPDLDSLQYAIESSRSITKSSVTIYPETNDKPFLYTSL